MAKKSEPGTPLTLTFFDKRQMDAFTRLCKSQGVHGSAKTDQTEGGMTRYTVTANPETKKDRRTLLENWIFQSTERS